MGSERILVVDTEQANIDKAGCCLKPEGFEITGEKTIVRAMDQVRCNGFDLVILQIDLNEASGFDLMARMLAIDKDLVVIMTTGTATVETSVKALKQGAWDYLVTPFSCEDLVKAVKNALSQKKLLCENRHVTARLAAAQRQYEYMVNHSPDLIFTLDLDYCFTFVNNQFEHLLGIKKKELIHRHFSSILHPDDVPKLSGLDRLHSSGKPRGGDTSLHLRLKRIESSRDPGSPLFGVNSYMSVELKAISMTMPSEDRSQVVLGIYCVARDISRRIQLEDQLRQSQKMQAIGTLAGGIAHDFNNILMGIQGHVSLAKKGLDPDSEEYERFNRIETYIHSGARMAGQLLGFAQKGLDETHVIDLNNLLKLSVDMFGRTKKDIVITLDLAPDLWGVQADEDQIKQVLMNLFVNALQAMPAGGTINVSSENVLIPEDSIKEFGLKQAGCHVKVTVSDTGCGISKDIIDQIFDPFFTTKEKGKGTGLGLATAYGIVKSHNGILKADSVPGRGSLFSFFLPAQETSADPMTEPDPEQTVICGRGNILLVDDEPGVIEVCSEMLTAMGYRVTAVTGGEEAIEAIKAPDKNFDMVILDLVMPGMDGEQTFEEIRRIQPSVRVLISSGYSKKEKIEQLVEKGCDGYILKPFDMVALSGKVNAICRLSQAGKE